MISFVGKNSIENLSLILKQENVKNALIFTAKKSYQTIKPIIEKELGGINFQYYSDFSTNPKKEEIDVALEKLNFDFDIIIAIGGGSVIDFAKAYRFYTKPIKLIAIPTTCGTGSEATQFAVIYINGVKQSLDDSKILPEYSIVEPMFVQDNPKYLKACTSMDAYCQAIESYWAVKANNESRKYALDAIKLCKENLVSYVNSNDIKYSEKMALASNLAGRAINISRTTAAHALSYKITSEYNIPHGHAVALSVADLFLANSKAVDEKVQKIIQDILDTLELKLPVDFVNYWNNLMDEIGLEKSFKKLGIFDKGTIIKSVNLDRLNNNPKNIDEDLKNFWQL